MRTDKTTKMLLALIALGLLFNVIAPLFSSVRGVRAAGRVTCTGTLKASPFGATAFPGGYDVDVTCHE